MWEATFSLYSLKLITEITALSIEFGYRTVALKSLMKHQCILTCLRYGIKYFVRQQYQSKRVAQRTTPEKTEDILTQQRMVYLIAMYVRLFERL